MEMLARCVQTFASLIAARADEEVLADACLGLSYLSAHSSSGVQARAQCELCVRLG